MRKGHIIVEKIRNGSTYIYRKTVYQINRRPLITFLSLLTLFILLIVLSNFLRRPQPVAKKSIPPAKTVHVYAIGTVPHLRVQAQVEKSGVVQITALMGGVIQKLPFKEGQHVNKGQVVAHLASNYFGGNAATIQRQIAQTQLRNIEQTLPTQKEIIAKQKEVAEKTDTNNDELRKITAQSIDETKSVIDLNQDILDTLDKNLKQLEDNNSNGSNDQMILTTKQLKSQFMSANNQLRSALRNAEYSSSDDNAPAQLSNLQKEITIKQLEVQEKSLELNREVTRLQVRLAQVNEGLMFPAAPFSGTVQRVLVKEGQSVQPGTPLLIFSQDAEEDPIVAIAFVSRDVALRVSSLEPSTLFLGNLTYTVYPSYITQDAIQGTLYGVYYPIPDNYHRFVTDQSTIEVEIPIGYYQTTAAVPFIPIDAVYQTQEEAFVYVVHQNKVESRQVELGEVYGRYVYLKSGLRQGDQVITDRNVIAGDVVKVVK